MTWGRLLLLSAVPPAGNFLGGLLADAWRAPPRIVSAALHCAAGIVIAIAAIELLPRVSLSGFGTATAIVIGGGTYLLLDAGVQRMGARSPAHRRMWMVYAAVALDLTSDGLMIGAASTVSASLAGVLALGQVLADIPEGYAAVATFRARGVSRGRRLLYALSFFAYALGAAALSRVALADAAPAFRQGALVAIAGMLIVAAVEDIHTEAHEAAENNPFAVPAFVGGLASFAWISKALGH